MRPRGDGKGTGASARLNTFDVTSLVVGSIIGADVYVATAIGARLVGPSSLLVWVLAGAMAMVIALSFSYCVMILPKVGGPYAYVKAVAGPFPGFIVGWGLLLAEWFSLAVFPVAFTQYFLALDPGIDDGRHLAAGLRDVDRWFAPRGLQPETEAVPHAVPRAGHPLRDGVRRESDGHLVRSDQLGRVPPRVRLLRDLPLHDLPRAQASEALERASLEGRHPGGRDVLLRRLDGARQPAAHRDLIGPSRDRHPDLRVLLSAKRARRAEGRVLVRGGGLPEVVSAGAAVPRVSVAGDQEAHAEASRLLADLEFRPVLEDRVGAIVPGSAAHPASGMRAGAAQVQPRHRRAVIRPTGHRPEGEELVRAHLPMRLVRFRQAEPALQVERRDHVAGEDRLREVRGVLGKRLDHAVSVWLPKFVP